MIAESNRRYYVLSFIAIAFFIACIQSIFLIKTDVAVILNQSISEEPAIPTLFRKIHIENTSEKNGELRIDASTKDPALCYQTNNQFPLRHISVEVYSNKSRKKPDSLQIYYRKKNEGYSEKRSIRLYYPRRRWVQIEQYLQPAWNCDFIRIDPGGEHSTYFLRNLKLNSTDKLQSPGYAFAHNPIPWFSFTPWIHMLLTIFIFISAAIFAVKLNPANGPPLIRHFLTILLVSGMLLSYPIKNSFYALALIHCLAFCGYLPILWKQKAVSKNTLLLIFAVFLGTMLTFNGNLKQHNTLNIPEKESYTFSESKEDSAFVLEKAVQIRSLQIEMKEGLSNLEFYVQEDQPEALFVRINESPDKLEKYSFAFKNEKQSKIISVNLFKYIRTPVSKVIFTPDVYSNIETVHVSTRRNILILKQYFYPIYLLSLFTIFFATLFKGLEQLYRKRQNMLSAINSWLKSTNRPEHIFLLANILIGLCYFSALHRNFMKINLFYGILFIVIHLGQIIWVICHPKLRTRAFRVLYTVFFFFFMLKLIFLACHIPEHVPPDEGLHYIKMDYMIDDQMLFDETVENIRKTRGSSYLNPMYYSALYFEYLAGKTLLGLDLNLTVLRLLSVLMFLMIAVPLYRIFQTVFISQWVKILAAIIVFHIPMFSFMGAAVSYDTITNILSILLCYSLIEFYCKESAIAFLWTLLILTAGFLSKVLFLPVAFAGALALFLKAAVIMDKKALFSKLLRVLQKDRFMVYLTLFMIILFSGYHIRNKIETGYYKYHRRAIWGRFTANQKEPFSQRSVKALENFDSKEYLPISSYLEKYTKFNIKDIYGIHAHRKIFKTKKEDRIFYPLYVAGVIGLIFGMLLSLFRFIKNRKDPLNQILLASSMIIGIYTAAAIGYHYLKIYIKYKEFFALNGRYYFTILAFLIIIAFLPLDQLIAYLHRINNHILKHTLLAILLSVLLYITVVFLYGDFPYLLIHFDKLL